MNLINYSAAALASGIKKGSFSAEEAVKAFLAHIEKTEKDIESFITITAEKALKSARDIDQRRRRGESLPPLSGVPIAVKDNICTKDLLTTCGSKMLEDYVPPYNAAVADIIDKEGMILVGKLNMDEFAIGSFTESSAYKITKNPRNLSHTPGGSSGGPAAAVAAGQVPLSLGTDTGGSVRVPASFCGIYGLKPTYGAVSRYGLVPLASSFDQIGPMAANAADLRLLFEAVNQYDKRDMTSLKPKEFGKKSGGAKVIGVCIKELEECSEDVRRSAADAIKIFEDMGHKIKIIDIPLNRYALSIYHIIASAEISSSLACFDGVRYGRRASQYDGLYDMYMKSREEGFGANVKSRIIFGTYLLSSRHYETYYKKALAARECLKNEYQKIFENTDILLTPATPVTAPPIGKETAAEKGYEIDRFTVPANILGLPALSMPWGQDKDGLPAGIQLIGQRRSDYQLLDIAEDFERHTAGSNTAVASL